jgi:hypothetical protein
VRNVKPRGCLVRPVVSGLSSLLIWGDSRLRIHLWLILMAVATIWTFARQEFVSAQGQQGAGLPLAGPRGAQAQEPNQAAKEALQRKLILQAQRIQAQPGAGIQLNVEITEETINRLIFVPVGDPELARKRLETMLEVEIDTLDQACKLTTDQKQKLELLGRGDIIRSMRSFDSLKADWIGRVLSREALQEIRQQAQPLQLLLSRGPFQRTSLLRKSLSNLLSPAQIVRHEAAVTTEKRDAQLALVKQFANTISREQGATRFKKEEFIDLLMRETRPPPDPKGPYSFYYLMLQIDRLPREKLNPLLGEFESTVMQNYIATAHRIEPTLRLYGFFSDDEEEPDGAAKPAGKAKN